MGSGSPPAAVTRLAEAIENDGGSVLSSYRDPLGGNWQIFAGLPIDPRAAAGVLVHRLDDEYDRLLAGERTALEADWKWRGGLLGRCPASGP